MKVPSNSAEKSAKKKISYKKEPAQQKGKDGLLEEIKEKKRELPKSDKVDAKRLKDESPCLSKQNENLSTLPDEDKSVGMFLQAMRIQLKVTMEKLL